MHILYLFYLPIVPYAGGVQRVTDTLAKELIRRGHKVYYLSAYRYPGIKHEYHAPQFYIDLTRGEEAAREYLKILSMYDIDIVINQLPRADLLGLLSRTPKGIIKISCFHGQPFSDQDFTRKILRYYKRYGLKEYCYKQFCRLFPSYYSKKTKEYDSREWHSALLNSNYVCLLSRRFIPRVQQYLKDYDAKQIVAINNPNAFDLDDYQQFEKDKLILWVARHDNGQKNFPLFVKFWARFWKKYSSWQAVVIGDGDDLETNIKYAKRKEVKNMRFMGSVDHVGDYYSKASFIIMTSFSEGWGMVLTEAMSFRCIPCVFDTFESLHDIIDNDVNGIIVPPFDVNNAIARIESILGNPARCDEMRRNCAEKVKRFSVANIVDQWEALFSKMTVR